MTDKQNFEKDINVPRKEQIMINGVDVSECEYLTNELEEDGEYYWFCKISPTGGPDECEYNSECSYKKMFKQLARKTQECEELKSQIDADYEYYSQELKTLRNIVENKEKRNAELFVISNNYRKALEEIEDYIYNNTDFDINDSIQSKTAGYDILQIIKDV